MQVKKLLPEAFQRAQVEPYSVSVLGLPASSLRSPFQHVSCNSLSGMECKKQVVITQQSGSESQCLAGCQFDAAWEFYAEDQH